MIKDRKIGGKMASDTRKVVTNLGEREGEGETDITMINPCISNNVFRLDWEACEPKLT